MQLKALADFLLARRLTVVTAESCTAGLAAKLLTERAGSSQWFERGFIVYNNVAKQEMLDVQAQTLRAHGAVSQAVVSEMCAGALRHSHADVALSISGIAGPQGGTPDKPVGLVWFGWALADGESQQSMRHFDGDRQAIRRQAADFAISGMLAFLQSTL